MEKLENSPYRKYFKVGDEIKIPQHPHEHEVPWPAIYLLGTDVPVTQGFRIATFAITEPFEMVSHTHSHDFDQYLSFYGCAPDMLDLGGEVEFTIGEVGKELQTIVFTKPFMVHVPPGVLHCPLRYTKIYDPAKPMIHQDLVFTGEYIRKPAG
ncbi:MAG: hypothetical protein JW990_03315 [Thermoleophilia bacterium]|nr:hypothetical protein [Thermoleophilia bacterium]